MARTAQTSREGMPKPVFHKATFTDHAGQQALRVRRSDEATPIPDDFNRNPVFCFQVYSTVPLHLDGTNNVRFTSPGIVFFKDRDNAAALRDYLMEMLASDAQRSEPVLEIYAPQTDVLACIEHQKREIASRKAHREDPRTLLIPKLVIGTYDDRKSGFLFVVNSLSYQGGQADQRTFDPNGPHWVWFNRQFPSATAAYSNRGLTCDPDTIQMDSPVPEKAPEEMELRVRRIQRPSQMTSDLAMYYASSCHLDRDLGLDLALDEDEGQPDASWLEESAVKLSEHVERLSLLELEVEAKDDGGTTVRNCMRSQEPDLRYVVYVAFLTAVSSQKELQNAAVAFTKSLIARLPPHKTVLFEFRIPPEPTFSSILSTHRYLMLSKPPDYIGALTSFAPSQTGMDQHQTDHNPHPARLYPISRREDLGSNLPATCGIDPYKTFIIILDRPDFVERPGVLFLLTDGGKDNVPEYTEDGYELSGPSGDFDEMQVWRSVGMDEVARRLAMQVVIPGKYEWDGEEIHTFYEERRVEDPVKSCE